MSENWIGLDFETYSDVDLVKNGLRNYVNSEYFTPLIAAVHYNTLQLDNTFVNKSSDIVNFIEDYDRAVEKLKRYLDNAEAIVAHNAGFEKAVLDRIGLHYPSDKFIDSAVVARAAGAGSSLEAAAPQLLGVDKVAEGKKLILKYCVPGQAQVMNGDGAFDPSIVDFDDEDWKMFEYYCAKDAELSLHLAHRYLYSNYYYVSVTRAVDDAQLTMKMNDVGWCVDLDLVKAMQTKYEANKREALEKFRSTHDPDGKLNFASPAQLQAWCAVRGIKSKSFDEEAIEHMLKRLHIKLITDDLLLEGDKKALKPAVRANYEAVVDMLTTKQTIGGSSLKKLQVIIDNATLNGRLHDNYLHAGAGQTLRTTGKGVQMQNLKRFNGSPDNINDINWWDNQLLAANLRQCFTASKPDGSLIVGDFSSVEARALAYLANETWALDAFWYDRDLYKELASRIYNVDVDNVSKEQRQIGKVGVLSCGYGAGPDAVRSFAAKMGTELTELEAYNLVQDWRAANTRIVDLWDTLNNLMRNCVATREVHSKEIGSDLVVEFRPIPTPESITDINSSAVSIAMLLYNKGMPSHQPIMHRVFHGAYMRGRDVVYYKPSSRKTGLLWSNSFTDADSKQRNYYKLYGGKLAGILTQSFCRELFFGVLTKLDDWVSDKEYLKIIGQFHDEIIFDYIPNDEMDLDQAMKRISNFMSDKRPLDSLSVKFPLSCEVKSDYRYTK